MRNDRSYGAFSVNKGYITGLRVVVAALLCLCLVSCTYDYEGSFYGRVVEDDSYVLELQGLNDTVTEEYVLCKGDTISVKISRLSGELELVIGRENAEPIYEGSDITISSFELTVPEDGAYFFAVTGKGAVGRLSFEIASSVG